MSELKNWCINNTKIPESIHEPYVASHHINYSDDDDNYEEDNQEEIDGDDEDKKLTFFRFLITTKHLLKHFLADHFLVFNRTLLSKMNF